MCNVFFKNQKLHKPKFNFHSVYPHRVTKNKNYHVSAKNNINYFVTSRTFYTFAKEIKETYVKLIISKTKQTMAIDKVAYWIEVADYDMETAETLYNGRRWLYVAFMCHQAIEKTLKAYWCKTLSSDPPYTHNLTRLIEGSTLEKEMTDEQLDLIDTLIPMNIQARYPEYKDQLSRMLTKEYCRNLIDDTKQLQKWIKNKL